jgi:hypothetical protein
MPVVDVNITEPEIPRSLIEDTSNTRLVGVPVDVTDLDIVENEYPVRGYVKGTFAINGLSCKMCEITANALQPDVRGARLEHDDGVVVDTCSNCD